MIITCNSCQKSFNVPDSAIGTKGRLVQCSACNNKWTQYPIKVENIKLKPVQEEIKAKTIAKVKKKSKSRKKKYTVNPYSTEYLQKKHGIKIINPSSLGVQKKGKKLEKKGFGFYNFLIIFLVSFVTVIGTLHLSREIISFNYPFLEIYLNYLFETIYNIKIIILDILS
tara:strand:- start:1199 stop:1705 length:507 start_codon:yes stop_codon:yes gene_type:complete